jgi:hypothetical protein
MNTKGKSHNIEPDDLDDFECAVWFEDMPDDEEEVKAFHRDALANISETIGIDVSDLWPEGSYCPDYEEVERRAHSRGYDTYNSDTRLIIFPPKPRQES